MADKVAPKEKITAVSVRAMSDADRVSLLAAKRAELLEARRSLKAGELVNPRQVTHLRRSVAMIMTVDNEQPLEGTPNPAGAEKAEEKA